MNLYVVLEMQHDPYADDGEDELDIYVVHGIAFTLNEAVDIAAQVRQTVELDDDDLQIEVVPAGMQLVPATDELGEFFFLRGAVAMYDFDGTLIRKVEDNKLIEA